MDLFQQIEQQKHFGLDADNFGLLDEHTFSASIDLFYSLNKPFALKSNTNNIDIKETRHYHIN